MTKECLNDEFIHRALPLHSSLVIASSLDIGHFISMQAREFLPQPIEIEVENHVEVVEKH
jgi:hypothetical protein